MECRVLFDYKAGEEDELDLKKGELVSDVTSGGDLEEGWWSGVANGKRGVFPNNFVEAVPTVPAPSNSIGPKYPAPLADPALRTGVNRTQRAKVTFSYKPVNSDELRLEVGDVVEIFAQVEDGWLSGFNKGSRGVFPSNFVEFIEEAPLPAEAPPARDLKNKVPVGGIALPILPMQGGKPCEELKVKKQGERAKVTFSYEPQEEDELKLEVGDTVEVLNKEHAEGWWEGRLNGKTGVFPNNFVELFDRSVLQKAVLKPAHPARAETDPEPAVPRKGSVKAPATAPKRSGPTNELQRKLDRRNLLNTDQVPPDNGQPAPPQAPRTEEHAAPPEEQKAPPRRPSNPKEPSQPPPDTRRGPEPADTRRGPQVEVPDTRRGPQVEVPETRRGPEPADTRRGQVEPNDSRRSQGDPVDTRRAPDNLPETRRAQVDPMERARGQGDPIERARGQGETADTRRGQGETAEIEGVRGELVEVRKELLEARREVTKLKQEYREDFDRISDEAREDRKQLAELKIEVEALKRRRADYWNPEKFF